MTKKELLNKYNELEQQHKDMWNEISAKLKTATDDEVDAILESKQYKKYEKQTKLIKQQQREIVLEYNKLNHLYWDAEQWVYDTLKNVKTPRGLTGQSLSKAFVDAVNDLHLNGCMAFVCDGGTNNWGAVVKVFTPHKVYIYGLNRGYNGNISLSQYHSQQWNTKEMCETLQEMNDKSTKCDYICR